MSNSGYKTVMINDLSLQAVEQAHFDTDLCRPLYDSYCFSRIPHTIHTYFTGNKPEYALPSDVGGFNKTHDFVVLFFIDGFGWRFFEPHIQESPFLQRFVDHGTVSKLTSQFPSTTAGHVTCMNTGLEVGESGLYEWFLYEPTIERVIAPLLCSFAGDKEPGTLTKAGISTNSIYPSRTIYEDFQEFDIHAFALQPISIAHSPYSLSLFRGATYLPYQSVADGMDRIVELYHTHPKGTKQYIYIYLSDIDSVGHRIGIESTEYAQITKNIFSLLEERFYQKLMPRADKKAACIVTADHGMIGVSPKETLYLNLELPEFVQFIMRTSRGELIVPAGSSRDFFLHIIPDALDEAERVLKQWLGPRALIVRTEDLIKRGFFGSQKPSQKFLQRVGNLVILPKGNHTVWWYEKDRFESHFYGMHGGLSRSEMEIPYLYLNF